MQSFISIRSTPFMKIGDKGGEVEVGLGQRGSNIEE
jgi:hypothetical protein